MKRTKKKSTELRKVDAILTADWHIRADHPTARTDDFWEAQWSKIQQVSELQKKHKCPVLHAGDLFHHWKPSPLLITYTLRYLPKNFWTVYGQHDLPQHSLKLAEKSGINTLQEAQRIRLLNGHWGTDPNEIEPNIFSRRKILVWHKLVYTTKPFPGAKDGMAAGILRKYSQYDLILTGDNHQAFTIRSKDQKRLLVNPGNMTRQTASQKDFRPRVYLWNAEANIVKPVYFDVKKSAISRQHIEQKQERDQRIQAFVERLGTDWESSLDFKENLRRFEAENSIEKDVMEIAYKSLEE